MDAHNGSTCYGHGPAVLKAMDEAGARLADTGAAVEGLLSAQEHRQLASTDRLSAARHPWSPQQGLVRTSRPPKDRLVVTA